MSAVGNSFSYNLRGNEASLLCFDRTTFVHLESNTFNYNGDTVVVGLAASLPAFIRAATALDGVSSLEGDISPETRINAFPLIFVNLGAFMDLQGGSAQGNWIYLSSSIMSFCA